MRCHGSSSLPQNEHMTATLSVSKAGKTHFAETSQIAFVVMITVCPSVGFKEDTLRRSGRAPLAQIPNQARL